MAQVSEPFGMEAVRFSYSDPQVSYGNAPELNYANSPGKEVVLDDVSHYHPEVAGDLARNHHARILGLRKTTFWLSAILLIVIVGAAIAGGVGGSLASEKHTTSSAPVASTPEPSSITTSIVPASVSSSAAPSLTTLSTSSTQATLSPTARSGSSAVECPSSNSTTYVPGPGYSFQKLCYVDWPTGENPASGNEPVADIVTQIAYTMNSCIDACYQYNLSNDSKSCAGVTYNANLTSAVAGSSGNCFLKSVVGKNVASNNLVESAALVKF